jgi:hypothetical protein
MKVTGLTRRLLDFVVAGAMVGACVAAAAPASASPQAVPFTDPSVDGSLTLCNQSGQALTSGSLTDVPFVWSVVSSSPAPKGYTRADLLAYQPIQYVDPSEWSGYQLMGNSIFSAAKHPVAQATYADFPLKYADESFPPHWDGLYQLRMYFSATDKPSFSSPYPAAVIQVSGSRWTLVSGGGTSCSAGHAVSVESLVLPKSETQVPHPLASSTSKSGASSPTTTLSSNAGKGTTPTTGGASTHPAAKPGSASSSHSGTAEAAGGTEVASAHGGSGGSSSGAIVGIVAVAVVAIGGGAFVWVRRRRRLSH